MAVETFFFFDDLVHYSNTALSIAAGASAGSATDPNGDYDDQYPRDTNLFRSWKPPDGTADNWLQVDGGSTTWIGATPGLTQYWIIAYDARGADQTNMTIQQDTADNPAGSFTTQRSLISFQTAAPGIVVVSFPISSPTKRYYRLLQANANRGGGTKTAKIMGVSAFAAATVARVQTDYKEATGPGEIQAIAKVGAAESRGGFMVTNKWGSSVQEVELNFNPLLPALWTLLRDKFMDLGRSRSFYLQMCGLQNAHDSVTNTEAALCRVTKDFSTDRKYADNYSASIKVVTESFRL